MPRVDPRSSASRKSRSSRRTLMLEHQQPLRCSSSPLHTHHRVPLPLARRNTGPLGSPDTEIRWIVLCSCCKYRGDSVHPPDS